MNSVRFMFLFPCPIYNISRAFPLRAPFFQSNVYISPYGLAVIGRHITLFSSFLCVPISFEHRQISIDIRSSISIVILLDLILSVDSLPHLKSLLRKRNAITLKFFSPFVKVSFSRLQNSLDLVDYLSSNLVNLLLYHRVITCFLFVHVVFFSPPLIT